MREWEKGKMKIFSSLVCSFLLLIKLFDDEKTHQHDATTRDEDPRTTDRKFSKCHEEVMGSVAGRVKLNFV